MKTLHPEAKQRVTAYKANHPSIGVKKLVDKMKGELPYINAKLVRLALNEVDAVGVKKVKEPEVPINEIYLDEQPVVAEIVDVDAVPYQIVDLPRKGKALLATRDIYAGELVIAEKPLLTISWEDDDGGQIACQVARLLKEDQDIYCQLHDKDHKAKPTADGIWRTNVLELGLTTNGGVFATCARINSSCKPNLNNTWNNSRGVIMMHAIRDIKQGEELTICYFDPFTGHKERRIESYRRYGFICQCEVCSEKVDSVAKSDERRIRLGSIQEKLQRGLMRKPFGNLVLIDEALLLLEEEGLQGLRSEFIDPAYRICFELGLLKEAKDWASKAYEQGRMSYGKEDWRVEEWKKWSIKPEKPKNWLEDEMVQAIMAKMI